MGTMARTAAIAGTATVTSAAVGGAMQKSAAKKQAAAQQQAAEQTAAEAPVEAAATAAPTTDEMLAQLQQLGQLRDAGILTDEEFEAKKAKILAQ